MMESMRIRVKLAKLTGKGKDLDLLPSDTLKDLEKKVRDLDKIGDHVGIVFYLEGSQLTQDDDLRSKLHPDVLLRYYLTGPEIDDGTALLNQEKDNYERQKNFYAKLGEIYRLWKAKLLDERDRLVQLPQLSASPKDFVDDKFVVRDCVLSLFANYEKWSEDLSANARYGRYISGPEGIGKSAALYFIACLARAMNWFVIYVARSDEWISESSCQIDAIRYFARQAAAGIAPFFGSTKLKWQKLIMDILAANVLENAQSALQTFIQKLKEYDDADYPILLVFDEAQAFNSQEALWHSGKRAASVSPFNIAASLDVISFKRGFKLISGTGHESFVHTFTSSMNVGGIDRYEPYSEQEFKLLLQTKLCPNIVQRVYTRIAKEQAQTLKALMSVVGTVPRQLKLLAEYESSTPYDESMGEKNIFQRLLQDYADKVCADFLTAHTNYLNKVPNKYIILNSTFNVLVGDWDATNIPTTYLDTSLVYKHGNQYHMVTPMAAKAIIQAYRNEGDITQLSDYTDVLDATKAADHRSRPFEKLIFAKLIKNGGTQVKTVRADGTDPKSYLLAVDDVAVLKKGCFIPLTMPSIPTLYIPEDRSQPLYDALILDPIKNCVFVIQITLQSCAKKFPTKKSEKENIYNGIFSETKFTNTIASNSLFSSNLGGRFKTAGHALLSLLGVNFEVCTPQLTDAGGTFANQLVYIVISAQARPTNGNDKELAKEYPWVRVVSRTELDSIFPAAFVEQIPKSTE